VNLSVLATTSRQGNGCRRFSSIPGKRELGDGI
jgi:hypothetical protein